MLKNRCHADEFDPLLISFDSIKVDPSIKVHSDGYHWAFPSLSGYVSPFYLVRERVGTTLPWKRNVPEVYPTIFCNNEKKFVGTHNSFSLRTI